jgi:hypothetical protein
MIRLVLAVLASPFKSKTRLEAENAVLRHQLIVLRRKGEGPGPAYEQRSLVLYSDVSMVSINPGGPRDHPSRDPCLLASGWFSQLRSWKSRSSGGRPQIEADLRALIRRIGVENPLWGVPRIHGELLKLGFEVAQSSIAKYMVKRRGPPRQEWRTFLRNHAPG